jgi:hypothetical protein
MSQERADFICRSGREDVLKLTGLLLDLSLAIHRQAIGEQPFRQPMPANYIFRTPPA